VKVAGGDKGLRGTEAAKEEIAAVATPSDALAAAADEAQPPVALGQPPSASVAAVSTEAAPGSANLMTLLGVALFLAAAVGGVVALVLQRRSSRSH
jgi:hypothetical protein